MIHSQDADIVCDVNKEYPAIYRMLKVSYAYKEGERFNVFPRKSELIPQSFTDNKPCFDVIRNTEASREMNVR